MADGELSAVARLKFIAEGAQFVEKALGDIERAGGDVGGAFDKIAKKATQTRIEAERDLKRIGDAAEDAGKKVAGSAEGWDKIEEAIDRVRNKSREFAQDDYLKKFGDGAIPDRAVQEMSADEQRAFLAAVDAQYASATSIARKAEQQRVEDARRAQDNIYNDYLAHQKEGVAAREAAAAQERRVNDVAARQWIEAEERKAATAKRVADYSAKQWIEAEERKAATAKRVADYSAKQWIEAEERKIRAAEERATAIGGRDYANFSTNFDEYANRAPGLRASETTFAREAQEYDRQVAHLAEKSSPRLRYALYDVATTAGIAATAIAGVGTALGVMAAQQESAFTNVERTLDGVGATQVEALRQELVGLTREIPLAFTDVAEIATLGNQLGIAAGDVASFTETVARFSAVTGMTADASATAFGSLGELLDVSASEYENLGSSIALVGRRSVATEAEIITMTQRLAASATRAGFTAEQVVALSGAFASLRIAPERAQGVMETYFNRLNSAVASGGPALEAFARVAGEPAAAIEDLARTDPVGLFEKIAVGLGKMDSIAQTGALEALGLSGLRAGEVFGRVSSNVEVFNKALGDAHQGWVEGSELASQYAKVVDDLASRWQFFLNAVNEAGSAIGTALAPAIIAVLDLITQLVQGFASLAENPVTAWMTQTAAALTGLFGLIAGGVAVLALAGGSLYALRLAVVELGLVLPGVTTGISGVVGGMFGLQAATGGAAVALRVFRTALATTGIGLAVVALGSLAAAFMNTATSADAAFDKYIGTTGGLAEAVAADTAAYQQALAEGNLGVAGSYTVLTDGVYQNVEANDENAQAIANVNTILGVTAGEVDSVTGAIESNTSALGANTIEWVRNQLRQSDAFREFADNQDLVDAWNAIGANFDDAVAAQMANGEQGVYDYYYRLSQQALASGSATIEQIRLISNNIAAALGGGAGGGSLFEYLGGGVGGSGLAGTISKPIQGLLNQAALLPPAQLKAASSANSMGSAWDDAAKQADKLGSAIGGGGGGGRGGGGGVTKKIRTLIDYANDLESVMSRAFDIRTGSSSSLDDIRSQWLDIAEANKKAAESIADYRRELRDIRADRDILEYQLKVADDYRDTERAAKIREELAELDEKRRDTQNDLSDAQAENSKTLTGNTKQAIANRGTILSLVQGYQGYLTSLAESGMSQDALKAKSAQLKQEFIRQATQLGFSRAEVEKYARSFNDMATIISRIPRNVTVNANVNPALQALAEFEAKAKSAASNAARSIATGGGGGYKVPKLPNIPIQVGYQLPSYKELMAMQAEIRRTTGDKNFRIAVGNGGQGGQVFGYASGGYTGNIGTGTIAGVVHGQEFVMSAAAVRNAGGPNAMAYLHESLKRGKAAGPMGGAPGFTQLDPGSIDLLARRIAYYSKDPGITSETVRSAVAGATISANRQGRS